MLQVETIDYKKKITRVLHDELSTRVIIRATKRSTYNEKVRLDKLNDVLPVLLGLKPFLTGYRGW